MATLPPYHRISAGEIAATVKIVPFAVLLGEQARDRAAPLRLAPFLPMRVGVVSTLLPGLKLAVVEKTLRTLEGRLAGTGAAIAIETRTAHERGALAAAIADVAATSDLIVIFGASAISERRDVVPAAIQKAGGAVVHLGMPVDPGNLLLLGALPDPELQRGKPVIGAPGCARSAKENGFDFVLNRLLASLEIGSADIRGMGVGGLLTEIRSRPQPRQPSLD